MKKSFYLLLFSALLMYLFACSMSDADTTNDATPPPAEHIKIYTKTIDASITEDDSVMVKASYRTFYLSEADAQKYSALDATLKNRASEMKTALVCEAQNYKSEVENYRKLDYVLPSACFYAEHDITVRRADSVAVSLLSYHAAYTGGAHGNYGFAGESYDTQTGQRLALTDVITDTSHLPNLIEEKLTTDYADIEFWHAPDIQSLYKDYTSNWTLDTNGITFYFDPYTFASFGDGVQAVTLTFAEFPDLFHDKYKSAPKSYGVQLHAQCPFLYDINGDGKAERLRCYFTDWDAPDSKLYIHLGDEQYSEAMHAQDAKATFILKGSKPLLYVTLLQTDGTQKTISYSLNEGIKKRGEVALPEDTCIIDGQTLQCALTNP